MKKAIATLIGLFVLSMVGSVHAEELIWNPTHVLGNMVIGYTDFFVQENGEASGVFTAVLEKDGSDNDFFDQLIVIGIPDSDRAMVIGIPAGAGGVAATPIVIPRPANESGKLSATPIVIPEPVINTLPMIAHIDHWSDDIEVTRDPDGGGSGGSLIGETPEPGGTPPGPNDVAMEFDPIPDPPPEGHEALMERDARTGGMIAELPDVAHIDHWSDDVEVAREPDGGGSGGSLIGEVPDPGGTPPGPNMF